MNIQVENNDILKLSDEIFSLDNFVALKFDSNDSSFGIKEILLRNILQTFGEEYKITSVEDYELDAKGFEVVSLIIKTNLPWANIIKLVDVLP